MFEAINLSFVKLNPRQLDGEHKTMHCKYRLLLTNCYSITVSYVQDASYKFKEWNYQLVCFNFSQNQIK